MPLCPFYVVIKMRMMKKFLFFLLALSSTISCTKDKDIVTSRSQANVRVFIANYQSPVVRTISATDIDFEQKSVRFQAQSVDKGYPLANAFGFQISQSPDFLQRKEIVCSPDEQGILDVVYENWAYNPPFYVRAFARSGYEVGYGEALLVNAASRELSRIGLMIQTADVKKGTWNDVKAYCENSVLDGYSDWRLPTRLEMRSILSECSEDGSFEGRYWTSEAADVSHYYSIDAVSGSIYSKNDSYKGRCIRVIE